MNKKTIFLVGADTGGHVVPTFAIAKELEKDPKIQVFVFGVGSEIEKKFYKKLHHSKYLKIIAGKSQFGSLSKISAFFKSAVGFFQSLGLITKYRPKVLFLKGNYATIPMAFAARVLFVQIVAHESDIIVGKSNRLISKFSKKLFVSYPLENYQLKSDNLEYSGPVLRPEFEKKIKKSADKKSTKSILILGGSQGAHKINQLVFEILPELLSSCKVVHQTGVSDINLANERKRKLAKNLERNYLPIEFIEDDFSAISGADLIISRASSSIFEFAAFEKPLILIPYPYAASNHQVANAKYFSDRGAAILLLEKELTPTILYSTLMKILSSEKRKSELGENLTGAVKLNGREVVIKYLRQFLF